MRAWIRNEFGWITMNHRDFVKATLSSFKKITVLPWFWKIHFKTKHAHFVNIIWLLQKKKDNTIIIVIERNHKHTNFVYSDIV